MRLCFVMERGAMVPPEKGGGVEEFVRILVKGLIERGHQISIVCAKVGDPARLKGVKFHKLKTFSFLWKKSNEILYSLEVPLFLLFNRRKYDLICFQTCQLNYTILSCISKLLTWKPVVHATHIASWDFWDVEYRQIPLRDRLNMKLRGYCKRKVDKVITPSLRTKQEIIKYTGLQPGKIKAVHYAIDTDLFSPKHGGEARHELGLDDDDLVVLFVGRLVEIKGVEYLLKAVPLVKSEVEKVKFVLVGGEFTGVNKISPRWPTLCQKLGIEEDVIFTGVMEYEMLARLYASADIFALPTMMESFCLVVYEALASGLPVISTDCADIAQAINKCGTLVNKRDEVDLANAIIKLAKDKALRKRYSRKALEVAESTLSIERFIDEYEGVFTGCLGNK